MIAFRTHASAFHASAQASETQTRTASAEESDNVLGMLWFQDVFGFENVSYVPPVSFTFQHDGKKMSCPMPRHEVKSHRQICSPEEQLGS
jgi:hypothetical protein